MFSLIYDLEDPITEKKRAKKRFQSKGKPEYLTPSLFLGF